MNQTALHIAAAEGDLDRVKQLVVGEKYHSQEANTDGETPLHLASRKGHEAVVKYLIEKRKYDPNCRDRHGWTPLHEACGEGHQAVVKYLVEEGNCDPNHESKEGWTPLHKACQRGHEAVVRYLIEERQCDPNCNKSGGRTPLHEACWVGHEAVVKYLIQDRQCDPNCRDNAGQTPLHWACWFGQVDVACYLLQEVKCNPNCTTNNGHVPLSFTDNILIIMALIDAGANPKHLYTRYLVNGCPALPDQTTIKLFMIGHPGAGKTTLTKALSIESTGVLSRLANHLSKVSAIEQCTAGIIPHVFESRQLGLINILDFAGHEEFHASHDAMVQNIMVRSTGVFLILADLQKCEEEFLQSIKYWLFFIKNHSITLKTKPHAVIVGTHSDQVSKQDKTQKEKVVVALRSSPVFSSINIIGYIEIDCRCSQSVSITRLREYLSRSCKVLKSSISTGFNYHCFFIFLLQVSKTPAIQLSTIISTLAAQECHELFGLLPSSPAELDAICHALSNHGRILYLRCADSIPQSWIIMDQHVLLAKVNGTIFAPDDFKEHRAFSSSTGVVPLSKLTPHFPDLNSDMITQFLTHFEFCHKILDSETLQLLSPVSTRFSSEEYFFFPSLVSASKPEGVWEASGEISYHTGWLLLCSKPEQFFTPRLLQVLLLRLTFTFALSPTTIDPKVSQHPALHRECKVWKNGIHWLQRTGVEGLIEMNSKQVTVLVRSYGNHEMAAVQLRSSIVHVVLQAQKQLCDSITPSEYLLHPSDATQYPLRPFHDLELFGISEISNVLADFKTEFVISVKEHMLEINKLLYFEPYAHLGEDILRDTFNDSDSRPIGMILTEIAEHRYKEKDKFIELFQTPQLQLQDRFSNLSFQIPIIELKCVFEIWAESQHKATRSSFRQHLDKYSIFAGRNPLNIYTSFEAELSK